MFLTAAEPHGGHLQPDASDWAIALAVFGGAVAVLAIAARWGSPVRRAALYAIAASISWALMAAFIKETTNMLAVSGVIGLLEHWPLYALIVTAIVGSVLQQAALQVGPLSVSQPLIVVVDPAVAIVLSVWIFDERFTASLGPEDRGRRGLLCDGHRGGHLGPNGTHRSRFDDAGQAVKGASNDSVRRGPPGISATGQYPGWEIRDKRSTCSDSLLELNTTP